MHLVPPEHGRARWISNLVSTVKFAYSLFIYFAVAGCLSAQATRAGPTSEAIIARMASAQAGNQTHFRPYIVTRYYKLLGPDSRFGFKSHVTAEITVVPPDFKKYVIDDSDGSSWGEKVVRKILDSEVAFAKDSAATNITRDNYDFRFLREDELDGQHCYVLELLPKRRSRDLLRGIIWLDTGTYLPHRVEGEPAKSPSWWLKDVHIVLRYGYLGTMWLQTSSEASADVRILGQTTIASQSVKYRIETSAPATSLVQTIIAVGETTTASKP